MGKILTLMIITAVITIIGGGGMYLLYLKTRPKKVSWFARVYHLGEGVRHLTGAGNKVLENLDLSDLKPFCTDILEMIDKAPGITIYKLIKLNKPTPAVSADCVEYWGPERKEVSVLIDGDNCTLLKKGYNRDAGETIFTPLPFDRINMIKSQMAIRKDRLRKEKDILQAITPWVVAGICMLSLLAIAYVMTDGFIEMHNRNIEVQELLADKMVEAASIYRDALSNLGNIQKINKPVSLGGNKELEELGKKLGAIPPSIE